MKKLIKQRLIEGLNENDDKYIINQFNDLLPEGSIINEGLLVDGVSLVKNFLTTHRAGELITALVKLLNKYLGIDKDLDGVKDNCNKDSSECGKMLIQKISDGLHSVHEKIEKFLIYISAVIKYKTIKPSKEQKEKSKGLAKKLFNAMIVGFLIYYVRKLGIEIGDIVDGDGSMLSTIIPGIGVVTKSSDLIKRFNEKVHHINSDH